MSTTTTKTTCPTCGEGNVITANNEPTFCDVCGTMPAVIYHGETTHILDCVLPTLVGRSDNSTIQVMGAWVSRHHCVVGRVKGVWMLTDAGSANGTYLNGCRIETGRGYPLKDGDVISVGGIPIVFECE